MNAIQDSAKIHREVATLTCHLLGYWDISAKATLATYADLFDSDLDAVADTLHARYVQASTPE